MMRSWTLLGVVSILGLVAGAAIPGRAADTDGWVELFDGKALDGWRVQGGFASYRVEDGNIVTA